MFPDPILTLNGGTEAPAPTNNASVIMELHTPQEAAPLLRLSVGAVYTLCSQRKIRHQRVGPGRGRILIPSDAIAEYLRSTTVEAEASPDASAPRSQPLRLKHVNLD